MGGYRVREFNKSNMRARFPPHFEGHTSTEADILFLERPIRFTETIRSLSLVVILRESNSPTYTFKSGLDGQISTRNNTQFLYNYNCNTYLVLMSDPNGTTVTIFVPTKV